MAEKMYSALVIDDNFYNRDIFRFALEDAQYTVTDAENGYDGLNLLDKQTYNLLVLDLQMPGINGLEVLKLVRENPRHKNMRIIVITANGHLATNEVDVLTDHLMFKPIDVVGFSHFVSRLKRVFDAQS
jgi:two-component system cell cycle response regulator DivK